MPSTDQAATRFLQDKNSTHDKEVGASAAHLFLALRHDFNNGEEHDLTEEEYAFLNTRDLAAIKPEQGLPLEWDTTYSNLRGIFAFIRAMLTHPQFNIEDYKKVCHNITRLAEMRRDHWATKEYHENSVAKTITPCMGEVINLVSHGVLNNEAFEVTSKGAELDRQDRLTALFDLFLDPPNVCSTGVSNDFLFVVDGYKGIKIIELLGGFLTNLALIFAAEHLREDYQSKPSELYQLVLDGVSSTGTRYDVWLQSKKADLENYLQEQCSALMLDKDKCNTAIADLIGALEYLEIPTDISPSVISVMKYVCNGEQGKNDLPVVKRAVAEVGAVLPKLKSLETVAALGLVDFYRGIELIQECDRFKVKHSLMNGPEVGKTQTSATTLMDLLVVYFKNVSECTLTPEQLTLSEEINQAAVDFHTDVRQYEFGHLIDFVKNFFALLSHQEDAGQRQLFTKMDGYRDRLLLTDTQLTQWQEKNTNKETGELNISPYEINQFIFNALWVNPEEWSSEFRKVLNTVLEWLHDDSVRDGLKENVKAAYMDWRLLGGLRLVLFMTRLDVPNKIRSNYLIRRNKNSFYDCFNGVSGMSSRFDSGVFFDSSYRYAPETLDEFLRSLKKFDLTFQVLFGFMSRENQFYLNPKWRELILNALLDRDVLASNWIDGLASETFYTRYMRLLSVFGSDSSEKIRLLDYLCQESDASIPEIFLLRSSFGRTRPYYTRLTEKLDAKVAAGVGDEISYDDFMDVFGELHYENDKFEWLHFNREWLKVYFPDSGRIIEFMGDKSYLTKYFFYEWVVRDRLREVILDAFELGVLLEVCHDFRAAIEDELFETLANQNDQAIRCWRLDDLYHILNEPNKTRLMRAWIDGQFTEKGNMVADDFDFVRIVNKKAKKSWQVASSFLTAHSPKLLDVVIRYVFQPTQTPVESSLAVEFLPLYFSVLFKTFDNKLSPDNARISALFLLSFHFRETFYLGDDVVSKFMRRHLENKGRTLRLSESEVACFVMHALHVAPPAWSDEFKMAFKVILEALKRNLVSDKESELRAPYCLPEFVYNLSALFAVARVPSMAVIMALNPTFLLDLGFQAKRSYSGETNKSYCAESSMFHKSYICSIFRYMSDVDLGDEHLLGFRAFFSVIEHELSFHIRSERDIVSLIKLKWLSSEQRDLILDVSLKKVELGELKISRGANLNNLLRSQAFLSGLNETQKMRVKQLFEMINDRMNKVKVGDWICEIERKIRHYYYSTSICFFAQKAKEKLEPKGQNKTIRVSIV